MYINCIVTLIRQQVLTVSDPVSPTTDQLWTSGILQLRPSATVLAAPAGTSTVFFRGGGGRGQRGQAPFSEGTNPIQKSPSSPRHLN